MDDEEELGDGTLSFLASAVADGTATPEGARRLLVHFVREADQGIIRPRMIEHMRDCVRAFLDGRKRLQPSPSTPAGGAAVTIQTRTMEKAFGLTRLGAGQPPTDDDTSLEVAVQVLDMLVTGALLEVASPRLANERQKAGLRISSNSQIRKAWGENKRRAWPWLNFFRSINKAPWTDAEMARLKEIYADWPARESPTKSGRIQRALGPVPGTKKRIN